MGRAVLKIAARGSPLSRVQVREALAVLTPVLPPETDVAVVFLETPGDRDKQTPLSDPSVPDDFFTRDLDRAVLDRTCDLTVHSAKDLPRRLPDGLAVAAILPCGDCRDALVFRAGIAPGAVRVIGTSGPRRNSAGLRRFPHASTRPIRGTIDERLAALDRGDYDAVIVAACALHRLGLAGRIGELLPDATTPLQGHLAVVVRAEADDLLRRLKPLDFRLHLFDAPPAPPAPAPAPARLGAEDMLYVGSRADALTRPPGAVPWPVLRLEPAPLADRLAALERDWASCAAVLAASPFAARAYVHALLHARDARALAAKPVLAAGPATADALERLGCPPAAAAPDLNGLATLAPRAAGVAHGRCFYPCSSAAPVDERRRLMQAHGFDLVPGVFYTNRPDTPGPLPAGPFGRVYFASPSAVRAYFSQYPDERTAPRRWLAIGPSTQAALLDLGLKGEPAHEPH